MSLVSGNKSPKTKNRRFPISHPGFPKETCLRDRKTGGTTLINTSADAFSYFSVNAGITLYLGNLSVPSHKAQRPVGLRLHENLPPVVFSLGIRPAAYFSFSLLYQYVCIDIRKLLRICQLLLRISLRILLLLQGINYFFLYYGIILMLSHQFHIIYTFLTP